ncbi:SYTC2-like protein [Mya arenaria]|uniref:SYTC2-like protein n=1 Tax=Mya arenaria TaxID=6604 RepID=A0ABY7DMH5_MYAAR|nr:SYTC2-like protein [Mya arenaria]
MENLQKGKKHAAAAGDQEDKLKELKPPPEFLASRLELWDKLKKEYDDWVAAQERKDIKVTLPDGKVVEGKAWETTPQGLADNTVIAKVNEELWDLDRPLEKDATLQLLKFDDKDGEYVFWHSSAHILGEAMECMYGGHLCYGPPIESGFYYDMWSDRCGPLIDLCRGPHVRHTGKIKSMAITKEQELFFFHELSPGSCFFMPKGAHIYNTLMNFCKDEYRKRGFTEVLSPNIYNQKLWEISGHWEHYSENVFKFDVEKETYALKPMNCPDFGVLHRNELSGALSGLTRVRRFQQDDAHIFCMPEQLDFQLPIRFNLSYVGASGDGEKLRPVIIHRAVLGSVERMMAILCEHYGGKWPFWLSPRQCIVIPVAPAFDEYAMQVKDRLYAAGFESEAELDASNTLNKKVRNAQLAQFNFILVVGAQEVKSGTANVRTRDNKVHGEHSIEKIIERFTVFRDTKLLNAEEVFDDKPAESSQEPSKME